MAANAPEAYRMEPIILFYKKMEKVRLAFEGKPQFFEWLHCRHDGTLFNAEVSLNRIDLFGKISVLAVVRDVTERKKVEEALKSSEQRFRQLAELLPEVIFEMDLNGNFTFVNTLDYRPFDFYSI